MNYDGCTCGPYMSVIPPEPCPFHDPERAYWRARLLKEFGAGTSTTTNTTGLIRTGEAILGSDGSITRVYHFMDFPDHDHRSAVCGNTTGAWTRVSEWVTCEACKKMMEAGNADLGD